MATLISRREAAQLSGTSESTVKKAVDLGVIPARRRGSQSCIEAEDVPVLTLLGQLTDIRLRTTHKRRLRAWLRKRDAPAEFALGPAIVIRKPDTVEQARKDTENYLRLRDKWIVSDPEIKGGEPVVRGSRVTVYALAARLEHGDSHEIIAEDYPHIPAEAREVAAMYARTNPRRGRPARPHNMS
jgi:excisionase family DNA binding protein